MYWCILWVSMWIHVTTRLALQAPTLTELDSWIQSHRKDYTCHVTITYTHGTRFTDGESPKRYTQVVWTKSHMWTFVCSSSYSYIKQDNGTYLKSPMSVLPEQLLNSMELSMEWYVSILVPLTFEVVGHRGGVVWTHKQKFLIEEIPARVNMPQVVEKNNRNVRGQVKTSKQSITVRKKSSFSSFHNT